MEFEEIESILWDGTKEQLIRLIGEPVSYSFSPKCGSFSVYGKSEMSRSHGAHYTPNCVKVFGNDHSFGPGSCRERLGRPLPQQ